MHVRSTDASRPACLTLFWPTAPGAPPGGLAVFTMLDSCVPAPQAGQGVLATTPPPPMLSSSPSHHPPPADDSQAFFLKPPAGAILEGILGAAAVSALVIVGCVLGARKVQASRALEGPLRAGGASRSSLTVANLSGQGGAEAGIPLSAMRPGAGRAARDGKPDGRREGGRREGLETSRG
ncbi:hypothetical protein Daus18300_007604 [Diaporthe australafricana]|uniref:Uncharacterized protein n=1 Tax=Diaporthe australafricana TaxID=127596 RepID=A0ABR3WLS8_9PEZI